MEPTLTRHSGERPPEMHELVARMRAEGLAPYGWDNEPGYVYAPHAHGYHKLLESQSSSSSSGRLAWTRNGGKACDLLCSRMPT